MQFPVTILWLYHVLTEYYHFYKSAKSLNVTEECHKVSWGFNIHFRTAAVVQELEWVVHNREVGGLMPGSSSPRVRCSTPNCSWWLIHRSVCEWDVKHFKWCSPFTILQKLLWEGWVRRLSHIITNLIPLHWFFFIHFHVKSPQITLEHNDTVLWPVQL